jgi:hypothetical protein
MYYMSTRSVRLDEESERLLAKVRRAKGLSASSALKQGLVALSDALDAEGPSEAPFEIYRTLDLGPGGYTRNGGREAKSAIQQALRRKARR